MELRTIVVVAAKFRTMYTRYLQFNFSATTQLATLTGKKERSVPASVQQSLYWTFVIFEKCTWQILNFCWLYGLQQTDLDPHQIDQNPSCWVLGCLVFNRLNCRETFGLFFANFWIISGLFLDDIWAIFVYVGSLFWILLINLDHYKILYFSP